MKKFTKSNPAVKPSHKGRLHKALGIPQDQPIPLEDLNEAMQSKNPHMRKMASYAKTMRSWKH